MSKTFEQGGIVSPSFKPKFAVVHGVRVCVNGNPSESVLTKEQCEALTELAKQPFSADAPVIDYNDFKKDLETNTDLTD